MSILDFGLSTYRMLLFKTIGGLLPRNFPVHMSNAELLTESRRYDVYFELYVTQGSPGSITRYVDPLSVFCQLLLQET